MARAKAVPAERILTRIQYCEKKIEELRIERDALRSLLGVRNIPPRAPQALEGSQGGLRPSEAILEFLRSSGPSTVPSIIEQLRDRVATNAKSIDRLLYSTVNNLRKAGKLVEAGGGRLALSDVLKKDGTRGQVG
ncbi:MAG: hypothetical protein V1790_04310 [Planctomycetota bacterium]